MARICEIRRDSIGTALRSTELLRCSSFGILVFGFCTFVRLFAGSWASPFGQAFVLERCAEKVAFHVLLDSDLSLPLLGSFNLAVGSVSSYFVSTKVVHSGLPHETHGHAHLTTHTHTHTLIQILRHTHTNTIRDLVCWFNLFAYIQLYFTSAAMVSFSHFPTRNPFLVGVCV